MWNLDRIRSPKANARTHGSPSVTVAVADTGLDFTHSELAGRIAGQYDSVSGTLDEVCKTYYGADDADLAAEYGGRTGHDRLERPRHLDRRETPPVRLTRSA